MYNYSFVGLIVVKLATGFAWVAWSIENNFMYGFLGISIKLAICTYIRIHLINCRSLGSSIY